MISMEFVDCTLCGRKIFIATSDFLERTSCLWSITSRYHCTFYSLFNPKRRSSSTDGFLNWLSSKCKKEKWLGFKPMNQSGKFQVAVRLLPDFRGLWRPTLSQTSRSWNFTYERRKSGRVENGRKCGIFFSGGWWNMVTIKAIATLHRHNKSIKDEENWYNNPQISDRFTAASFTSLHFMREAFTPHNSVKTHTDKNTWSARE